MVLVKRQEVPTKRVAMKVVAQFPVFDVVVLLYVVCLDILFSFMILDCLFSVWIILSCTHHICDRTDKSSPKWRQA